MHLDVGELNAFYLSPMGRIVRQIVTAEVRAIWPSVTADRLAGLGHVTPYLRPFLDEAERVVALMPAAEGVHHWPPEGPNVTALAFEDHLPLPDASVDKLMLVHILETARDPHAVMEEVWRILTPSGRALAVVPYRTGAWAKADHTPFGLGRPFSRYQLTQLMEDSLLKPREVRRFLFAPPTRRRFIMGSGQGWERVGRRLWPRFAGVLAIEAEKTFSRAIAVPSKRIRGIEVLVPGLAPVPKPAMTRSGLPFHVKDASDIPSS
ncbi:MAG: methyltransferase domain-containing protein [Pseudomonadota bacterium]